MTHENAYAPSGRPPAAEKEAPAPWVDAILGATTWRKSAGPVLDVCPVRYPEREPALENGFAPAPPARCELHAARWPLREDEAASSRENAQVLA